MAGIIAALALEALLVLLLLSLNETKPIAGEQTALVSFTERAEPAPEPSQEPEQKPKAQTQPVTSQPQPVQPSPLQPAVQLPAPTTVPVVPTVQQQPTPAPTRRPLPATSGPAYGPVDNGGPAAYADTARVGTAPNGEPLYAAAWYREPYDDELRGYLSTASGPGWGLIACRTAPDFRVEDCVGLDEYPHGSMITRAVLAAAWQFKVRPPRIGGRLQIGDWVRIRIDYDIHVVSR
ncbi:MAG: hypothetical protein ABIT16_12995 [Croceibacterium sp.]